MLGAQLYVRTIATVSISSDRYTAASPYPTASSSCLRSSSLCSHFTTKRRRPSPKPVVVSCHSAHGGFRPQSSNGDNRDHQFLEASLLVSETILHYRMWRHGFQQDVKGVFPMSRAKITSIGQAFLSRFPSPTIFLKIPCDGEFLLPIVVGEFSVEKLIAAFWGDDKGDTPDQFQLVNNVVEKLGYEVWISFFSPVSLRPVENFVAFISRLLSCFSSSLFIDFYMSSFQVKMVRITERVVNTYFAKLYLSKPGENDVIIVDARPSDAINVANRCKVRMGILFIKQLP
ncbi:bifunctional nuclease 2-like isoform X2 [Gossypium australe]|uniref:Bifunctional nuclease 2-like isoform X2 n=1 Tax=Gossypium australe TaxID=47621 RepID=A0A5B6W0C1_9ROSI|nr:bifunctional nuclease 2-like isoform X2 [Gossypium australe]